MGGRGAPQCVAPPGVRGTARAAKSAGVSFGAQRAVHTPGVRGTLCTQEVRCARGGGVRSAQGSNFGESVALGFCSLSTARWVLVNSWVPGSLSLALPPPQVAESGLPREQLPLLEVSPHKRLPARPEPNPCSSRPAPEGAGAGAEQGHSAGGGGSWCRHCHTKLVELKRQAWKLVSGPGTPLQDPCLSARLLDKFPVPGVSPVCHPEAERRCDACATHLHQLTREALRLLQVPASREDPGVPRGGLVSPGPGAMTSPRDVPGPMKRQLAPPDRRKGLAWPAGPSVQVSVAPAGLGGALSTVTIQAQPCLEGMWNVSRASSFLPPTCLAEAAVAAVAVADSVRDGTPIVGPSTLATPTPGTSAGGATGPSAAASFFIRAAQKLSLASKRKKHHPVPAPTPHNASAYPTDFSGILQLCPPPVPPCLLRAASKAKDNPGSFGKVKVMLRIWPTQGGQRSAESASFLKVDPRKKQVTLYDPVAGSPGGVGLRRAATAAAPRMFAFDAVFPADSEQAEVCSGSMVDVLQSVVGGADGCIFSFGHRSLGKSYTMIGKDSSPQSLGVVPCAISWLFRLVEDRRERTGTRFSIRVSAVEVYGQDQSLRDLLADVASSSLQDAQSPGMYLREDVASGTQLQSQSELRAPTAEKAAFYLDAALAARSTRAGGDDRARSSHLLFTLHVYQYHMEKCSQGAMSGGRSRLHLIDLGSCEMVPGRGEEVVGGSLSLSLSALGSIILALVNGAKHVPYRDHRLTVLLRESLATTSCRTTMIAHVSDAPAHHAETLSTVQLAARIHRLRRKKAKHTSSSSGGESSCEEGRARRVPHLRPFHSRAVALDPDCLVPGLPGDPDYSSSSEQSCDTVIYVGPGGTALSDRELTDNEGPPDSVPIIPSLSRRRPSEGPRDADHFRCSTFAELQERLECIDGSEGPPGSLGSSDRAQASPARGGRKPSLPEAASPRKAIGPPMASSTPRGLPGPDYHQGMLEPSRACAQGDQQEDDSSQCEPAALDKTAGDGGQRLLPSLAPLTPRAPEALGAPVELGGRGTDGAVWTPPVGTSGQGQFSLAPDSICPCPSTHGCRLERGLLTTTVTLQQPVELNGEDELVFTVVEELPLGVLASATRPSSLASFGSNCSLQALASGSRPVSIISSINDEFDAYTSQAPEGPRGPLERVAWPGSSPGSSVGSWLNEVGISTALSHSPTPHPPFSPDAPVGLRPPETCVWAGPLDEGVWSAAQGGSDASGPAQAGREPWDGSSQGAAIAQTIHSSLPRKPRTTSVASRVACAQAGPSPPSPRSLFGDPWLLRADDGDAPSPTMGCPRIPEKQGGPACAQRVLDSYAVVAKATRRPEAVAWVPPLRRGATTLGVTTPSTSFGDAVSEVVSCSTGLKGSPGSKKSLVPKGGFFLRPGGVAPPAPPVRKSSLEQSSLAQAPVLATGLTQVGATATIRGEEEVRSSGRADHAIPKSTSSLKARAGKMEVAQRPAGHMSLERYEGLAHSNSKVREVPSRPPRAVPRLGVPPASPTPGLSPACRGSPAKATGAPKPLASGTKSRSLVAGGSRALGGSMKPLGPVAGRPPGGPGTGPRAAPRAAASIGAKAGRGTIMGTKQALRAAHSRVHELAASGAPARGSTSWGSADSDSGNDSGVNVAEEQPPVGPALPSPYSKVTAPRRPQRYSSGHGSDNSSVLSGELPPAMGRTALFYHSGGSSGYESMMRDSEATGSASSAPDSMSESGAASLGARSRSLKSPKKRATGLQRRRLIPAPLPDATALGRKPALPGQWVDLPPPLAGSLKEPFEIKVYEIDDVARLQRHRLPLSEDPAQVQPSQELEKGLMCVSSKLRLAERRQQRLQEVQAKRDHLCEELAETQGRLMVEPGRWLEQFEVDPELEPESAEYLVALERATAALEQCVNLCKAHVMMVTCFDISVTTTATMPGAQEVDV